MGVFTRERNVWQVRAALDQHVIGFHRIAVVVLVRVVLITVGRFPLREEIAPYVRLGIHELQQINQVSCRAEHRTAVLTLTKIHRAEQRLQGGELFDQLIAYAFTHGERRRHSRHRRFAAQFRGDGEQVVAHTAYLLCFAVDQPGLGGRRRLVVFLAIFGDIEIPELRFGICHHVEGGGHSQAHQHRHRLIAWREIIDALQRFDLLVGSLKVALCHTIPHPGMRFQKLRHWRLP